MLGGQESRPHLSYLYYPAPNVVLKAYRPLNCSIKIDVDDASKLIGMEVMCFGLGVGHDVWAMTFGKRYIY